MIDRQDLRHSGTVIPRILQRTALRVGGKNPFGEPMFRIILAEDRIARASGNWNIFKPGSSLEDRAGLGIKHVAQMLRDGAAPSEIQQYIDGHISILSPERVVKGMMTYPLYGTLQGFVIEKWKPADNFGSPADWNSLTFMGEPALGPYPEHGEYELCAGPTPYMPTVSEVEEAIQKTFRIIDERKTGIARTWQNMQGIEAELERQHKDTLQKISDAYHEDDLLMKTSSLAAGRVRNELAKQAGITEHVGN